MLVRAFAIITKCSLLCRPPPIDVQSTDDLLVHAYNSLDQPMTLHHHGMFFNSTTWMDGAVGISQWYVPAFLFRLRRSY